MSLLREPHHDGSPLYVDDEAPVLGQVVAVRVRISNAAPLEEVWLRTTYDAEPVFHEARPARDDGCATWWEALLPIHNPRTHYRFLLVSDAGRRQRWLTGSGLADVDVPDSDDFVLTAFPQAPDWGRDGVVYQVFPDRFARSAGADARPVPGWAVPAAWDDEVIFEPDDPRTPRQFYGGDLDGLTERLDHIAAVGADIVYTTPVFPGESNHRYNATTFDEVDPLLGGDAAYARLSAAVHARGWRILGDLTTNHTGDTHEWFTTARDDAASPERGYYYFGRDGSYESWMGHHTLPKVDHTNDALRAAMVEGPDSVVARWLQPPYDVDGWRIDVANMTGRLGAVDVAGDVARGVRATAEALRPDAWVIGEHNHDAAGDVDGDGWHGTMNYSGFSWPLWSWLRAETSEARPFGRPVPLARRDGVAYVEALRRWMGRYGWRATAGSWNILGSHDSARIRTVVGTPAAHRVAVGLQFTLPGVPMVFAGDEIGLEGVTGEDSRRPMPWDAAEGWDSETLALYGALAALRRAHPGLRRGGLRWAYADADVVAYVREHPEGRYLVVARRAAGGQFDLDVRDLAAARGRHLLGTAPGGNDVRTEDGRMRIPASCEARLDVWQLDV